MPGRRKFLCNSLSAAGGLFLIKNSPFFGAGDAGSVDSRIEVLLEEPLGTISQNIYGHFTEHLGGVIYDGIWVGEN